MSPIGPFTGWDVRLGERAQHVAEDANRDAPDRDMAVGVD
jgi:hypothetical protein